MAKTKEKEVDEQHKNADEQPKGKSAAPVLNAQGKEDLTADEYAALKLQRDKLAQYATNNVRAGGWQELEPTYKSVYARHNDTPAPQVRGGCGSCIDSMYSYLVDRVKVYEAAAGIEGKDSILEL